MEPGTYIAVAEIAFRTAVLMVRAFRRGLNFGGDAERLVLKLEVERFRLQIWGENSGLVPLRLGDAPSLPARLEPLGSVLRAQLEAIGDLFQEHEALSGRYGLERTEEPPTGSERLGELVARMQRSFRSRRGSAVAEPGREGAVVDDGPAELGEEDLDGDGNGDAAGRLDTSLWNKIRWSIRDLKKFNALVAELAGHITRLNQLLTEAQQRRAREDDVRVSIVVVGSAVDAESLGLIRAAAAGDPDTSRLRAGIERKAISAEQPAAAAALPPSVVQSPTTPVMPRTALALAQFDLHVGFEGARRFLTGKKRLAAGSAAEGESTDAEELFLFERKDFGRDIQFDDKRRLTQRIQRLVMLLSRPKPAAFLTPQAEGCIHDPEHFCWWLVFRFPLTQSPPPNFSGTPPPSRQPLSLRTLLDPKTRFRPPLEQRYALASALCGALSELYASSWLHKGIRSDNILFPASTGGGTTGMAAESLLRLLRSPLVCGFDYSRHESEWVTIDRARTSGDVAAAMYRHPAYQGDAAQGYRLEYDLYSLGLVLLEIGTWSPLSNFLEGRPAAISTNNSSKEKKGVAAVRTTEGEAEVTLSRDMKTFHAPHAALLKRRVAKQIDSELAFRAGTSYFRAVKFCLEAADRRQKDAVGDDDGFIGDVAAHPALEFYNAVVVPLERLAAANPV